MPRSIYDEILIHLHHKPHSPCAQVMAALAAREAGIPHIEALLHQSLLQVRPHALQAQLSWVPPLVDVSYDLCAIGRLCMPCT